MKKENVSCVEIGSCAINTLKKPSVITAYPKSIKKIGKADTYNLEVKDTHNFVANGVVVHNCIDASRYIIEEFKETGRSPVV